MRSAPSIAFDYRPARAIAALTILIVLAAATAPWLSAAAPRAKAAVSVAAFGYGVIALRRFARTRFVRIAYGARGWVLVDEAGAERAADLGAHSRYGHWIALDFRLDRKRRFRALVGPGNADADTRRRLILLLSRAEVVQPA
jgi:hypothetical protein